MKQTISQLKTGTWTHSCGFFLGRLILALLFSLSSWIYRPLRLSTCCDGPYLPMWSIGLEPGLYIILRSSCRLFDLSLPIRLIRLPCVYSISLIRSKESTLLFLASDMENEEQSSQQSVYLRLFSLIRAQLVGSWHRPRSCPHMLTVMTSLLAALFYHVFFFFILSLCPHDISFMTETMSCRLSSLGLTER